MKKFLLLCAIVVIFTQPSFSENVDTQSIIQQSSVSIVSFDGSDGIGFCSGVVFGNTDTQAFILTAKHCVEGRTEIFVETNLVTNIITSTYDDLAFLTTDSIPNKVPAKLAINNVSKKEQIYLLGYPLLVEYYVEGNVYLKTSDCYYAKLEAIPGCSGGGIWNSDAELVGIIWGGIELPNGVLAIFEPISDVYTFLEGM